MARGAPFTIKGAVEADLESTNRPDWKHLSDVFGEEERSFVIKGNIDLIHATHVDVDWEQKTFKTEDECLKSKKEAKP